MFGLRSLGIADRQDGKCWEDLTAVVPYAHWLLYLKCTKDNLLNYRCKEQSLGNQQNFSDSIFMDFWGILLLRIYIPTFYEKQF